MITKKTGFVIAAAAAAVLLSGCTTGARNMPENMPVCETPCAAPCTPPCDSCKGMSSCKSGMRGECNTMMTKHKKRHHRHCKSMMKGEMMKGSKEMMNGS